MKLASYKDGSRDGQLVVVSRDLATAHYATGVATRLQHLLDDWGFVSPQLEDIYDGLNQGRLRHAFKFDPARCGAPLARAGLWARPGSSTSQEAASMLGPADAFNGATGDFVLSDDTDLLRVGVGIAAILGDVPRHAGAGQALDGVRLLMLVCDGWLQDGSPLQTAFGPVAVTPSELGGSWKGGRVGLTAAIRHNTDPARHEGGDACTHVPLGDSISALARHRALGCGSIVGSGPLTGAASVVALRCGDRLGVEMRDEAGRPLFGGIEQQVTAG